jgi:NADPH:quinone reductase-like Zn-dependent oxidoreductase
MIAGMLKNAYDLVVPNIVSGAVFKGSSIRWGTFMPLESGIKELAQLAEEKKLVVPIDSVFEFADMKDAFKKVKNGHIRGKVVVTFNDTKINTKN